MKPDIINTMKPLSEIIAVLQKEGHTNDFDVNDDEQLIILNSDQKYKPSEVEILKTYRFEGMSNPGDSSILYLLKTKDGQTGTILDAYGADNSIKIAEFFNQIK